MVSAAAQRQEIYVWTLNNRTGANIDYRTVSCLLLPKADILLKLPKNPIQEVNSSLWDIPSVMLSYCLVRVCTHSSSCNVEICSNNLTQAHTHTHSAVSTHMQTFASRAGLQSSNMCLTSRWRSGGRADSQF